MQNTLAQEIWPLARSSRMAQALLVVAGTVLLAASAKVQVPFWPVPMTMQTFVVLLLGIAYGPRLGFITGALYLVEGAFGLPVFAKGAGMAYLMGPTGGYLFGFVAAMGIGANDVANAIAPLATIFSTLPPLEKYLLFFLIVAA